MAPAAYNLCILLSPDRSGEAVEFCRKASELRPEDPRYSFTLAYYLYRKGEKEQAAKVLDVLLEKHPNYRDALLLRRNIQAGQGRP
jgi:Flp pilus assembly protein TadD